MHRITASLASLVLGAGSVAFAADSHPDGFWSTPAIAGYGQMHFLPQGAYRPDPSRTYRVVFTLSRGPQKPSEVNPSLDHVARAVNLYAAAGVPLSHLKFVAIAAGPATPLALDDEHYKKAFGVPNPNLPLIAALRHAGVDIAVCGQAVAEHDYQYEWLDHSVTLALSALTTVTTLEERGYHLMPL